MTASFIFKRFGVNTVHLQTIPLLYRMEISGINNLTGTKVSCIDPSEEAALFVKLKDGNAASFAFHVKSSAVGPLDDYISSFRKIIFNFDGKIHQPELIRISANQNICVCICTGFDIKYTEFEKSGASLAAEITMTVTPKYFEASSKL